jgi:hypothetical protein
MTSLRSPHVSLTNAHVWPHLRSRALLAISCCTCKLLPCTAMHICHSNHVVLSLQCIPASQNSLTSCSLYGFLALCGEIDSSKTKRFKRFGLSQINLLLVLLLVVLRNTCQRNRKRSGSEKSFCYELPLNSAGQLRHLARSHVASWDDRHPSTIQTTPTPGQVTFLACQPISMSVQSVQPTSIGSPSASLLQT